MGWPQWMRSLGGHSQIQSLKAGSWGQTTSRSGEVDQEELRFLVEFSKFMNQRVPHLLQVCSIFPFIDVV